MALDDKDIFAAIFAKHSNQPIEYVMAEYEKAKRLNMEIEKRLMEQAEPVAPVKPVAAPVKQVTLIPEIEKKQYTQADLKFAPATAITDKSITCCLCGKQALTLTARHLAHHEISVEDYKKLCGYEPTQKLMAREYLAKMTDNARRAQEARAAKRMEKEGQEG